MTTVLGIDPGATTAMVVRTGDVLWATKVLDLDLARRLEVSIDVVLFEARNLLETHAVEAVAVEGAVAPTAWHNGKVRITDPGPIIGTAHLVGAIVGCLAATIVAPASHGMKIPAGTPAAAARRMLEALYPPDLIGPRETTGRSKNRRQHLRAAWDVAGTARQAARARPLDL